MHYSMGVSTGVSPPQRSLARLRLLPQQKAGFQPARICRAKWPEVQQKHRLTVQASSQLDFDLSSSWLEVAADEGSKQHKPTRKGRDRAQHCTHVVNQLISL